MTKILDVWLGSEYASAIYTTISIRRLSIRDIYSIIIIMHGQKSTWPHVQHICWMTKNFNTLFITICFYKLCLVRLIYFMLILNSRGIKYKVGNCHLLQSKILIFSLLYCCLIRRRPLRRSVWFCRIYILINESPRLSPWNAVVQNMDYQRGYSKIHFTSWSQKQPKM